MHLVIPLKYRELEFLREVFPDGSMKVTHQLHPDSEDVDEVLNAISDRFISCGIDEDYEPTPYGRELDGLLSTINRVRLDSPDAEST